MELKQLSDDLLLSLGYWLDTSDLISYSVVDKGIQTLLNFKPLWLSRAKKFGIYGPEFDCLELVEIRARLIEHMRSVYRQIRTICPQKYARLLTNIVLEDDAQSLECYIKPTAKKSVTALLPIAMQFGRIRIMHSIFTHFQVAPRLHWLLMSIRFEYYSALKYLVEVLQLPLETHEPYQLYPVIGQVWDPHYVLMDEKGRRYPGRFRHYNELLLCEIIRCRHPKIIGYLQAKLEKLHPDEGVAHPHRVLYKRMKRHSIEQSIEPARCDSPDLEGFKT